jgi:hypothetical protein
MGTSTDYIKARLNAASADLQAHADHLSSLGTGDGGSGANVEVTGDTHLERAIAELTANADELAALADELTD